MVSLFKCMMEDEFKNSLDRPFNPLRDVAQSIFLDVTLSRIEFFTVLENLNEYVNYVSGESYNEETMRGKIYIYSFFLWYRYS